MTQSRLEPLLVLPSPIQHVEWLGLVDVVVVAIVMAVEAQPQAQYPFPSTRDVSFHRYNTLNTVENIDLCFTYLLF